MSNLTALINAIAPHRGCANGISAKQLAAELGVPMRRMRRLVTEARLQGLALCGRPETGYFLPETADELEDACAFLKNRAVHSLRLLSRMKGVAMPTLLGQMRLIDR